MNWAEQLAKEAAESKMVLLFHGCPIPTGLNRTYPNVLNYEAVLGEEENFWRRGSDPDYHALLPFIRTLAGPIDYTPGSMRNKTKLQFYPVDLPNIVPSSMGTRAHELSMYIVFDQWLGYLSDAPTEYMKYPDILDFLSTVPVVWDKTVPLDAEVGKYMVVAKQTGKDWYVGGMSNWSGKDVTVDFSFLTPGVNYEATIIKDGANASSYPTRTETEKITITSESVMNFSMAKGGGFVIRLVDGGTSGIGEVKTNSNVSAYIDANRNMLNVQSETTIQSVKLINISGQVVLTDHSGLGSLKRQINISELNKGIYIVEVQTENGTFFSKVIY
jgi:alpha-glucosidase